MSSPALFMRTMAAAIVVIGVTSTAVSAASPKVRERSVPIELEGQRLTLHLASPVAVAPSAPLVLYASGDGGWFGAAVDMFHTLARAGLPVVGMSTRSLLHIERRSSRPLSVSRLTTAYRQSLDTARAELGLPADVPIVVTGWSRGAALAVLVANSHEVDPHVAGIVAIGLAAEERLDVEAFSDNDQPPADSSRDPRAIAIYPLLARLTPERAVVIQASGDGYLAASRARELFGPDTAEKRLVVIEARNHRFDGGKSNLAAALVEAVGWVSGISSR